LQRLCLDVLGIEVLDRLVRSAALHIDGNATTSQRRRQAPAQPGERLRTEDVEVLQIRALAAAHPVDTLAVATVTVVQKPNHVPPLPVLRRADQFVDLIDEQRRRPSVTDDLVDQPEQGCVRDVRRREGRWDEFPQHFVNPRLAALLFGRVDERVRRRPCRSDRPCMCHPECEGESLGFAEDDEATDEHLEGDEELGERSRLGDEVLLDPRHDRSPGAYRATTSRAVARTRCSSFGGTHLRVFKISNAPVISGSPAPTRRIAQARRSRCA